MSSIHFNRSHVKNLSRCVSFLAALAAPQLHAAESDTWAFNVRPYIWAPSLSGTLRYGPPPAQGAPEFKVGANDYLQHLNAGLMLSAEARKGEWALISDLIYLDMGLTGSRTKSSLKNVAFGPTGIKVSATADTGSETSVRGLEAMLAAARTVTKSERNQTDIVFGVRYLGLNATTDWKVSGAISSPVGGPAFAKAGSISQSTNFVDAIIGVRGELQLGNKEWVVPYYLDLGAGKSSSTWQAMTGISYRFGWGDATLAYRHVHYEQSGGRLLQSLTFSGPALGATFHF